MPGYLYYGLKGRRGDVGGDGEDRVLLHPKGDGGGGGEDDHRGRGLMFRGMIALFVAIFFLHMALWYGKERTSSM